MYTNFKYTSRFLKTILWTLKAFRTESIHTQLMSLKSHPKVMDKAVWINVSFWVLLQPSKKITVLKSSPLHFSKTRPYIDKPHQYYIYLRVLLIISALKRTEDSKLALFTFKVFSSCLNSTVVPVFDPFCIVQSKHMTTRKHRQDQIMSLNSNIWKELARF